MRKLLLLLTFSLLSISSYSQAPISVAEGRSYLNKSKSVINSALLAKGFFFFDDANQEARSFAEHVSEQLGGTYTGKGYGHLKNYAVIAIYNSSGHCVGFQFGTKRPKEGEIKKLASTIVAGGYKKTSERESSSGESNLRSYDKGDIHLSLSSIYDGGYTLTIYLNSVFK